MWLFGYGSLIWKVDFPVQQQVVGYIKGYVRRFYQASPEHRGEPTKPGRVVTLIPTFNEEDVVWGVAYLISDEHVERVLNHLDYREKSGYEKRSVEFYPKPESSASSRTSFNLTVYIADQTNEWFVEEPDLKEIARRIADCRGASGTNSEYLLRLAEAVRSIAPEASDSHLFQLETAVKKILQSREPPER